MKNRLPEHQLEAERNEVATTVQLPDVNSHSETCLGEHDPSLNAMGPIDMGVESMRTDTNEDLLVFVDRRTEDEDSEAASKADNRDADALQQPATEASRQPTTLSREEGPEEQTLLRQQLDGVVSIVRQTFTKENAGCLGGGRASPYA